MEGRGGEGSSISEEMKRQRLRTLSNLKTTSKTNITTQGDNAHLISQHSYITNALEYLQKSSRFTKNTHFISYTHSSQT